MTDGTMYQVWTWSDHLHRWCPDITAFDTLQEAKDFCEALTYDEHRIVEIHAMIEVVRPCESRR